MLARRVLDMAEEQGLLDGKAILELRRKLGETRFVVTPEAIAKVLVDSGHLTAFQARKLVGQALGAEAEAPARSQPGVKRVAPPKEKLPETVEMQFAEEEEEKAGHSHRGNHQSGRRRAGTDANAPGTGLENGRNGARSGRAGGRD